MLKYQIYKSMLKDSPSYGKYYARIVSDGTLDVKGLAEHMAKHNTPFSPGTITGILTDAISCIKELALDGKRITLDGLVSIGLSISHKMGAETAEANVNAGLAAARQIVAYFADGCTRFQLNK